MNDSFHSEVDEYLPLRDVVFKTLRKGILTGELKPGERLMEIHLAHRLGVSRTPIREAIRKLELEGLVTMIPRKGAEVSKITSVHLHDVLEVRSNLESFAAQLACERITEDEKKELEIASLEFAEATKTKIIRDVAEADIKFHTIILGATRNQRLVQLVNNLSEQMYRYRFEYLKDEKNYSNLIEEHEFILLSINQNNKDDALQGTIKHIDNQEKSILAQLEFNQ